MTLLPKHILNALRTNKTSLGEQPCYPPEEEEKFIVNLMSQTFDKLCTKSDCMDYETLKNSLSNILQECGNIEKNNRQQLEELCLNVVNELFHIPEDTIDIDVKLVDKIDTATERIIPEKTSVDFVFDDIDDMNSLTAEIYKRRMLNALVAGAAMFYADNITSYVGGLFNIDSDLPSLYKKALCYNSILLFLEKDSLDGTKYTDGGKVDVTISSDDTHPIIKAEGLFFPSLLEETIKGLLELAIAHGLPKNAEKAKYVMNKSDFKLAEIWDMRLGYALWRLIDKEVTKCGYSLEDVGINFFLMFLAELECKEFNQSLQEIFAHTKKGRQIISDICEEIIYNKEQDEFDAYVQTKNDETLQINDADYFTPEELMINDDINYGLNEDATPQQLRKAVNMRMNNSNSVKISRTADGEYTTVQQNKNANYKRSLSRLVIKTFEQGYFQKAKVVEGTQDALVRQYNTIIKQALSKGFIKIKTSTDTVINKSCTLLMGVDIPVVQCMYIETDDLTNVTDFFDLKNAEKLLQKKNINTTPYRFPDETTEKVKVKRPHINVRSNWDWVENGTPRLWRHNDKKQ